VAARRQDEARRAKSFIFWFGKKKGDWGKKAGKRQYLIGGRAGNPYINLKGKRGGGLIPGRGAGMQTARQSRTMLRD